MIKASHKTYIVVFLFLFSFLNAKNSDPDWYTYPPTSLYFDFYPARGENVDFETAERIAEKKLADEYGNKTGKSFQGSHKYRRVSNYRSENREINDSYSESYSGNLQRDLAIRTHECSNGMYTVYALGYNRTDKPIPSCVKESFLGSVILPGYGAFRYGTKDSESSQIIGLVSALTFYPTLGRGLYLQSKGNDKSAEYWYTAAGVAYATNLVTSYFIGKNREKTFKDLYPEYFNNGAIWKAPVLNAILPGSGTARYANIRSKGATAIGIVSSAGLYTSLGLYASYKTGNYDVLNSQTFENKEKEKYYLYAIGGLYGLNLISGTLSGATYKKYLPIECKSPDRFVSRPPVKSFMMSFIPGLSTCKYGKGNFPTVLSAISATAFYAAVTSYILDRSGTWHIAENTTTAYERVKSGRLAIGISAGTHLLSGPMMGMSYQKLKNKYQKPYEVKQYSGGNKAVQGFFLGALLPGSMSIVASENNPYAEFSSLITLGFYGSLASYLVDEATKDAFFTEHDRAVYEKWQEYELIMIGSFYVLNVVSSTLVGSKEGKAYNYSMNEPSNKYALTPYFRPSGEKNEMEVGLFVTFDF